MPARGEARITTQTEPGEKPGMAVAEIVKESGLKLTLAPGGMDIQIVELGDPKRYGDG